MAEQSSEKGNLQSIWYFASIFFAILILLATSLTILRGFPEYHIPALAIGLLLLYFSSKDSVRRASAFYFTGGLLIIVSVLFIFLFATQHYKHPEGNDNTVLIASLGAALISAISFATRAILLKKNKVV